MERMYYKNKQTFVRGNITEIIGKEGNKTIFGKEGQEMGVLVFSEVEVFTTIEVVNFFGADGYCKAKYDHEFLCLHYSPAHPPAPTCTHIGWGHTCNFKEYKGDVTNEDATRISPGV